VAAGEELVDSEEAGSAADGAEPLDLPQPAVNKGTARTTARPATQSFGWPPVNRATSTDIFIPDMYADVLKDVFKKGNALWPQFKVAKISDIKRPDLVLM
jgi:hypothetical protein